MKKQASSLAVEAKENPYNLNLKKDNFIRELTENMKKRNLSENLIWLVVELLKNPNITIKDVKRGY
jgi:hypothetical protein